MIEDMLDIAAQSLLRTINNIESKMLQIYSKLHYENYLVYNLKL